MDAENCLGLLKLAYNGHGGASPGAGGHSPQPAPPRQRAPRGPHHRTCPSHALPAGGGEPTDDRRWNARLRRVLHLAASVPGATSFWRGAARRCRAARKPLGSAPWLPMSRAPPPVRSCTGSSGSTWISSSPPLPRAPTGSACPASSHASSAASSGVDCSSMAFCGFAATTARSGNGSCATLWRLGERCGVHRISAPPQRTATSSPAMILRPAKAEARALPKTTTTKLLHVAETRQ